MVKFESCGDTFRSQKAIKKYFEENREGETTHKTMFVFQQGVAEGLHVNDSEQNEIGWLNFQYFSYYKD